MSCHFEVSMEGSKPGSRISVRCIEDPHAPTQHHEDRTQAIWSREGRNVRWLRRASKSEGYDSVRDHRSSALTRTPQGLHFQAVQQDDPKELMNPAKEHPSMHEDSFQIATGRDQTPNPFLAPKRNMLGTLNSVGKF